MVEDGLAASPALRAEAESFRTVVAQLPLAAPNIRPPESLKARLMERVAAQRPLDDAAPTGWSAAPALAPPSSPVVVPLRPRRWLPLVASLAAVLLLAVLGFGWFNTAAGLRQARRENEQLSAEVAERQRALDDLRRAQEQLNASLAEARQQQERLSSDLSRQQAEAAALRKELGTSEQLVAFLSGPELATRPLLATAEARSATGTMYMRPGDKNAVVLVSGLPPLQPNQSYQFWLARQGAPLQLNAGILAVGTDGVGRLLVNAPLEVDAFNRVMVTLEQGTNRTAQPADTTVLEGIL